METLELMANEKSITFELSAQEEQAYVTADRDKIGQVLTNLIRNSIAYGNDSGFTRVTIFSIDDLTTIQVSDNGIGIDESEHARLFERFYRVEKSRTRHKGGSGLGLAIVKHIIDAHNQKISVQSTPGIGSQFHFSLDKS
jgi:two-component system phosphate regulon sensor histidine kinase PhoR